MSGPSQRSTPHETALAGRLWLCYSLAPLTQTQLHSSDSKGKEELTS